MERALVSLLRSDTKPRAIVMIGTSAPCARFIRLARVVMPQTLFLNVSFVGGEALAAALGPVGEGVIVTQVVPHFDAPLPLCREYLADLTRASPGAAPGFVSLEGYVVARIFVEGLRRAGADPTRESLVDAIESFRDVDLGLGPRLSYGRSLHQGAHRVWPTVIRGGKFVELDWPKG